MWKIGIEGPEGNPEIIGKNKDNHNPRNMTYSEILSNMVSISSTFMLYSK